MPEREDELLLDHEYDGIQELDNRLPGWWLWLFYLSIIFSVVYLGWYHVLGKGPLQAQEYTNELAAAEAKYAHLRYEPWGPDVEAATDEAALAAGKTTFTNLCAVCHGQLGEGLIGPNFTDDYFIHGPALGDQIVVIEEGVPEKGMISWKTQLSRDDIRNVASYIETLRGTDPPNQKAPEGDLAPNGSGGDDDDAEETASVEGSDEPSTEAEPTVADD